MATSNVLFSRGSSVSFVNIPKDPNTLYFLSDTHELYLGGERFGFGDDVSVNFSGSGDSVVDVTYSATTKTLTIVKGNAGDIQSVKSAISEALQTCVKTITSSRSSSILVDSTDPEHVVLSLNLASGDKAGNVSLEECSDGLKANVQIPEPEVVGISPEEKILSLSNKQLSTTLSITTERDTSGNIFIVLKGLGGAEISRFDASDFVKAGMLKSVSLEEQVVSGSIHKILVLVFYVEGGREETLKVDLQDLVDLYTAAPQGGLSLSGTEFSIDNSVEPYDGQEIDRHPNFGDIVSFKTTKYDSHGLVVGQGSFKFYMPTLSGSAGSSDNTRLLTYISVNSSGEFIGQSIDISSSISEESTAFQIPTAKAVYDAVEEATTTWERF